MNRVFRWALEAFRMALRPRYPTGVDEDKNSLEALYARMRLPSMSLSGYRWLPECGTIFDEIGEPVGMSLNWRRWPDRRTPEGRRIAERMLEPMDSPLKDPTP